MISFKNHRTRALGALILIVAYLFLPGSSGAAIPDPARFFLVSVGCGDPDNITLKAQKTIEKSQLVFCSEKMKALWPDMLKGKECLPRPTVAIHKYFVALKTGFSVPGTVIKKEKQVQVKKALETFIQTVTQAVKSGKTVCLLDHGDPCIYGPYIWTMEMLKDLDPKVIPGVSSLNAANAALGKGLTFGNASHSAILTNAADLKKDYPGADTLDRMAATRSSMVIFTMFTDFEKLVGELKARYPEQTPMALVVKAGYDAQERVIQGTLADIVSRVKAAGKIPFEHLIYLGDFMETVE